MSTSNLTLVLCRAFPPFCWFTFSVSGLGTTVLVVLGLSGIAYSSVRVSHSPTSRLERHVRFLMAWDALLLVSVFGFVSFVALKTGTMPWNGWPSYLYKIFYTPMHLAMTASIWSTVLISFERYRALSRPFEQRAKGTAGIYPACGCVALCSMLIEAPTWYEIKLTKCFDLSNNSTDVQIMPTQLRWNQIYAYLYRIGVHVVFVSPVPFLLVLALTLATVCIRQRTNRSFRRQSVARIVRRQVRREWRVAAQLVSMLLKFMICNALATALNVAEKVDQSFVASDWFGKVVEISNLLIVFNSATNWITLLSDKHKAQTTREATVSAYKLSTASYRSCGSSYTPETNSVTRNLSPASVGLHKSRTTPNEEESLVVYEDDGLSDSETYV